MILIVEQDVRSRNGSRFDWKPGIFRGRWDGRRMWRIWWGMWSLSYHPSPGIKDFFDHVDKTEWKSPTPEEPQP